MSKMVEKEKMQACRIVINTTVDGCETQTVREGEIFLTSLSANLVYREENAEVSVVFENGETKIERRGDYALSLHLKSDEITQGGIGLGNSQGEIQTYAYKVAYSLGKDSVLAVLHYDLIIGKERQGMKLRLHAKLQ